MMLNGSGYPKNNRLLKHSACLSVKVCCYHLSWSPLRFVTSNLDEQGQKSEISSIPSTSVIHTEVSFRYPETVWWVPARYWELSPYTFLPKS